MAPMHGPGPLRGSTGWARSGQTTPWPPRFPCSGPRIPRGGSEKTNPVPSRRQSPVGYKRRRHWIPFLPEGWC